MDAIPIEEVTRIRQQIARANTLAAERFRHAFAAQSDIPPNERWRVHLEIQAAALLETATGVSVDRGAVHYDIVGQTIVPWVVQGEPLYPHFRIDRDPAALFEYWMIVSELLGTAAWRMTTVVATHDEYNAALARMKQPQIVRALVGSFLPGAEWKNGTAFLEVSLYTRAGEERIERRLLALDERNELHFHSRELIAEGRGGV